MEILRPLGVLNLKTIFIFHVFFSKDPYISMRYSTLFHACPWAKEIPFQLPEGGASSRPGSAASDNEVDRALKGWHRSTIILLLTLLPLPMIRRQ